jgi:hypothetical protein
MNEDTAHGGLLLLIGELLYKNQLLREAIASKNQAIDLIIARVLSEQPSTCTCGVSRRVMLAQEAIRLQESEFTIRSKCYFNDFGDMFLHSTREMAETSPHREAVPRETKAPPK